MSEIEGNLRPGEYVISAQVPRWKGEVLIPFRADRQLGEALSYAKAEASKRGQVTSMRIADSLIGGDYVDIICEITKWGDDQ
ncbi:hypothetical protein SEA_SQUIDDLY_57 [Gordonia phage Squiddly]|nr:hypothetical protein SEA_SQUIDDLY_57 [Gordonia phage Squiddly]